MDVYYLCILAVLFVTSNTSYIVLFSLIFFALNCSLKGR